MEQGAIVSIAWNSKCSSSRHQHICVHDIHRNIPWSGVVIFEKNPLESNFASLKSEVLRSQRCFGKNKLFLYKFKFFQFNLILAVLFWCQILFGLWVMIATQSLSQVSNTDRFKKDTNVFSSFAFLSTGVVIRMTCTFLFIFICSNSRDCSSMHRRLTLFVWHSYDYKNS